MPDPIDASPLFKIIERGWPIKDADGRIVRRRVYLRRIPERDLDTLERFGIDARGLANILDITSTPAPGQLHFQTFLDGDEAMALWVRSN